MAYESGLVSSRGNPPPLKVAGAGDARTPARGAEEPAHSRERGKVVRLHAYASRSYSSAQVPQLAVVAQKRKPRRVAGAPFWPELNRLQPFRLTEGVSPLHFPASISGSGLIYPSPHCSRKGLADDSGLPMLGQTVILDLSQPALLGGDADPGDSEGRPIPQPILRPVRAVRRLALLALNLRRLGRVGRPHVPPARRQREGQ